MKFEDINIEDVDFGAMLEEAFANNDKESKINKAITTDMSVKYILSYYLAGFLKKRTIPKYFNNINSVEYIEQITEYIEKLNINTTYSKKFLEDNQKYELLSKFNRR